MFLEHTRAKFVGFQVKHDKESLAGLPQPIHEGVKVLKQVYIFQQIWKEIFILSFYPFFVIHFISKIITYSFMYIFFLYISLSDFDPNFWWLVCVGLRPVFRYRIIILVLLYVIIFSSTCMCPCQSYRWNVRRRLLRTHYLSLKLMSQTPQLKFCFKLYYLIYHNIW